MNHLTEFNYPFCVTVCVSLVCSMCSISGNQRAFLRTLPLTVFTVCTGIDSMIHSSNDSIASDDSHLRRRPMATRDEH